MDEPRGVELVWPGKRTQVERIALPFQTIETVNEGRAAREDLRLFRQQGEPLPDWRNKLIWGDNLYVMGSLLEEFAGQIDLIYIDPPFATGADFSFTVEIGDEELTKEPSLIEEKAYRDTWGRGLESYLQMIRERIALIHHLLSEQGIAYVHLDHRVQAHLKLICDEVFGSDRFLNIIAWRRQIPRGMKVHARHMPHSADYILMYGHPDATWNEIKIKTLISLEEATKKYMRDEGGFFRTSDPGTYSDESLIRLHEEGRIYVTKGGELVVCDGRVTTTGGSILVKYYREQRGDKVVEETVVDNIWDDVPGMGVVSSEYVGFPTQKPLGLLERIVYASSNPGDLVADFFCGSGTTLVAAERLGRRWIGCDLSRWAIHTTRKRLLDLQVQEDDGAQRGCRPFEVVNLGKYERRYWQVNVLNGGRGDEQALWEYIRFIVELYGAQTVSGFTHLHGRKGERMVHVGATDAPVTMFEIEAALAECQDAGQKALDALGWEWEMGLYDLMPKLAEARGIDLRMLQIPREVMDPRAVESGDVQFYELAYLDADLQRDGRSGRRVRVALNSFVIPNPELIPPEVREKIRAWSDYIDYWAVDWDYREETFHNQWQDYRTRRDRSLRTESDWHAYDEPGTYQVMVKVIDIFGNDTTRLLEAEIT